MRKTSVPPPGALTGSALFRVPETHAFAADHMAGLHRGLLLVLTLAIVVLLPMIVLGARMQQAWTGPVSLESPFAPRIADDAVLSWPLAVDRRLGSVGAGAQALYSRR